MNPTLPLLMAAAALTLIACGGAAEESAAPCPRPPPVGDVGLLPPDIPLDEWGVVDQLEVKEGFLAPRAISETQIVELYPVIARLRSTPDTTS